MALLEIAEMVTVRVVEQHKAGVAQLVERNLAKVEVESSRLFSRSKFKRNNESGRIVVPLSVSRRRLSKTGAQPHKAG